jgi:hypothetical protein
MLLLVGAWAYTDALAELAQGVAMGHAARLLPYAWVAFGVMIATVALAIRLSASRRRPARAARPESASPATPPAAG